jgi:hypothetical protein
MRLLKFLVALSYLSASSIAFALEAEKEEFFALKTISNTSLKTPFYAAYTKAGFFDSDVETKNSDSKQLDQRYIFGLGASGGYQIGKMNLYGSSSFMYTDVLQQDSLSADRQATERVVGFNADIEAAFSPSASFTILPAVEFVYLPKSKRNIVLSSVSSERKKNAALVYSPRLSILKDTSNWSAGFYYALGREVKRKIEIQTGDENELVEEYLSIHSAIGGLASFKAGNNLNLLFSLALIQAGNSEEKTETNNEIYRDYYRVIAGMRFPMFYFGGELDTSIDYKTLSYNDQSFMDFQTIPVAHVKFDYFPSGADKPGIFAGFDLGVGQDSQSLPELNAEYTYLSYQLKFGFKK